MKIKKYVKASDYSPVDPDDLADLYVIQIVNGVEDEIIAVFATSPQDAKEKALMQWDKPVDSIEIIDINPESDDYNLEACSNITASDEPKFFGVGGHLKHFLHRLAKEDADNEIPINNMNDFRQILEDNGFEDIDEEELENGYAYYLEIFDTVYNIGASTNIDATQKAIKSSLDFPIDDEIFEDEFFIFHRTHGVGRNDIPWYGLEVRSKDLAKKHVIEIRLNSRGFHDFENEDEVIFTYSDAYVAQGMRSQMNTLDETEEVIEVLQDAVDFARRVNEWLYNNQ